MAFDRPSVRLSALRTSQMLDTSSARYCSGAVFLSSINHLSDVRDPLEITLRRHLESVRSCNGTQMLRNKLNSLLRVTAAWLMLTNAINSLDIAERVIRRDL